MHAGHRKTGSPVLVLLGPFPGGRQGALLLSCRVPRCKRLRHEHMQSYGPQATAVVLLMPWKTTRSVDHLLQAVGVACTYHITHLFTPM